MQSKISIDFFQIVVIIPRSFKKNMKNIKVIGARTHNLKNITVEIPKEKISVISGISGSGKSSLAFDTIFAEGQRRYVDNLSSYARQVIGVLEKPDVDAIEGIPPAISIDQKSISRSPRSTVGTLTETYDYLRLIFARFGKIYCPQCHEEIVGGDESKVEFLAFEFIKNQLNPKEKTPIKIFSTLAKDMPGAHTMLIKRYANSKFKVFRIDNKEYEKSELSINSLDKNKNHTIEVLSFSKEIGAKDLEKESQAIKAGILSSIKISDVGITVVAENQSKEFSKQPTCPNCNIIFPSVQPRLFSFNSPYGACTRCQGLGVIKKVQPDLVIPNTKLTISEGAIRPWTRLAGQNGWLMKTLMELAKRRGFSLDTPVMNLTREAIQAILYGDGQFEGVIANLERKYRETDSDYLRSEIEQYMVENLCGECSGERLNRFALSVKLFGKNISDFSNLEISKLIDFIKENDNELPDESNQLVLEFVRRLKNINGVGLGYLTLARSSETLSGGEAQRIRLGVQFDSFLSGVLYVLDEPTISLHSADTEKLIQSFKKLKDEGNTVIIVEHDKAVLQEADYIYDIGPGAGKNGGYLIASGTPSEIMKDPNSVTGKYLSGKSAIPVPKKRRKAGKEMIKVIGATHNNLKNINVEIPLGMFVCVTGVAGSGKSSLVYDIVAKTFAKKLYHTAEEPGEHKQITGLEYLDKVIRIDQSPIGRTPRSNLATYTGLFTPIRELFASTSEAILKGFNASRFSFNLKGGRCETCRGDGVIKIEMYFMPDAYVTCEDCSGNRYNAETLEIKHKGKNIADILKMSVDEAADFFEGESEITDKLSVLKKVGLGYLPLGQSATTLSGGEAQRIKLATELSRPSTGKTIYILDEPTTGLHFEDIGRLLSILQELVDRGNTVLVIEHNLDVIKCADWIIDMGPDGGAKGGEVIAKGTPEEVVKSAISKTARFLKEEL